MNDKYQHIDVQNEKVIKIINAAYEVFATASYEKASTNAIVKKAGVSRGLLYHYFKDKKDLYDFLIYYGSHVIMKLLNHSEVWEEQDYIKRVRKTVLRKFQIVQTYPYLIDFFVAMRYQVTAEQIKALLGDDYINFMTRFNDTASDGSLFKEGIDIDKAKQVINWTLEKRGEEYQYIMVASNKPFDGDEAMAYLEEYFDFLREQFYK